MTKTRFPIIAGLELLKKTRKPLYDGDNELIQRAIDIRKAEPQRSWNEIVHSFADEIELRNGGADGELESGVRRILRGIKKQSRKPEL